MKRKVLYAQFFKLERWDPSGRDPARLVPRPVETMILDRSWSPDKWAQVAREHLIAKGYYAFSLNLATKRQLYRILSYRPTVVNDKFANSIEIRPMEIHLWS